MGRAARERVLDEHTYLHRARQLLELVGIQAPAGSRG
jgi:spore maturation protein CgeB